MWRPVSLLGVREVEDELTQLQLHIENGEWDEAMERTLTHPDEILPTTSKVETDEL